MLLYDDGDDENECLHKIVRHATCNAGTITLNTCIYLFYVDGISKPDGIVLM